MGKWLLVIAVLLTVDGKMLTTTNCKQAEPDNGYDSVFVCKELYDEPFEFENGVSGVMTKAVKTTYRVKLK